MHPRDDLAAALEPHGLILRGGFSFGAGGTRPARSHRAHRRDPCCWSGRRVRRAWRHFLHWRQSQPTDLADPLDSWSREVIGERRGGVWSARRFAFRPALSAVPAMGDARRRVAAVAARHPHASALRTVACLSRRIAVRRRDRGRSSSRGDSPLRHMRWKTLPESLSRRSIYGRRLRPSQPVSAMSAALAARACRDGGCLDRNACPYRNRVSLRRRSAGVPHGGFRPLKVASPDRCSRDVRWICLGQGLPAGTRITS